MVQRILSSAITLFRLSLTTDTITNSNIPVVSAPRAQSSRRPSSFEDVPSENAGGSNATPSLATLVVGCARAAKQIEPWGRAQFFCV